MPEAMEDVLNLPVGRVQLGSSAPNSPMKANDHPQPPSDGFAPSSPIDHTQKSIRERQNNNRNPFNDIDSGNLSQTFNLDVPALELLRTFEFNSILKFFSNKNRIELSFFGVRIRSNFIIKIRRIIRIFEDFSRYYLILIFHVF